MLARVRYMTTVGARRRLRDLVLRDVQGREDLARRYLRGDGIEIGAWCWPLRVPPQARVRYVDRASKADLVAAFDVPGPDPNTAIPDTDVIDDAQTLATFADASVDFVIANHVLEHLEDPVGALRNLMRVLRPDGVLFLTLPDARHSFDAGRARTTVEHVLRDHEEGPEASRREHYEEWATHIDASKTPDDYAREDARHHFHVWALDDFLALLRALELPVEAAQVNGDEFSVVLRSSRSRS